MTARVFAKSEDTHTLRLVSKLPDLWVGYVNRIHCAKRCGMPLQSETMLQNKKHPRGVLFVLARVDKKDANYTIVAKRGECKPNQKIFVKKYVQQHYRSDA